MRIIEARDGFIKFESDKKLPLSSFWQVKSATKSYIAQIILSKRLEDKFIAFAKILFNYDKELKAYDKTLPSSEAVISEFTLEILSKSLEYKTPVYAGKFITEDINIPVDKSCFNKDLLICMDNATNLNIVLSNLYKQFSKLGKVFIIDMLGIIQGQKFVAGKDFKLPLNSDSLEFMYEDCLNDATQDSKALIKEIFQELSEYSKTVPFVPFGTLKSIVDSMVEQSHIFKLLVLKNKLAKFSQQGYFASTETDSINLDKMLKQNSAIIDISKLDSIFQNRYLKVLYSAMEKENSQIFLIGSNALDKKSLQMALLSSDISTTFVTHSRFKYINEIKAKFNNFIIEPSFINNETFKIYSTFLSSMSKDTYLLVGEGTNYIPLVSIVKPLSPEEIPTGVVVNFGETVEVNREENKEEHNEEENNETSEVTNIDFTDTDSEQETELEIPVVEKEEQVIEPEIIENNEDNDIELVEELSEEDNSITETEANEAIEKKSEELIEKVSENIEQSEPVSNIFGSDLEEGLELENNLENDTSDIQELTLESENSENLIALETDGFSEISLEKVEPLQELDNGIETIELTEYELQYPQEGETQDSQLEEVQEEEYHTEVNSDLTVDIPQDISDFSLETEELVEENSEELTLDETEPDIEETIEMTDTSDSINSELEELATPSDLEIQELGEEISGDETLDLTNSEPDVVVDLGEDDLDTLEEDDLDKQIVEDVDKVFTTIKDDSISDSDLDFIDELNNEPDDEILETLADDTQLEELEQVEDDELEEALVEPIEEFAGNNSSDKKEEVLETRNTSTPIVPVYDADIPQEDLVMSDAIEQGDTVIHAKYGTGFVEKMIKYGSKTLYSINFDNLGRRLLDPTLTEIKKA
jgi:hypothetical protein